MHINLMRPCVGIGSPEELYDFQKSHRIERDKDGTPYTFFTTRNTPKRAEELINGGSVFWITKSAMRMRQSIINVETLLDEDGKKFCKISTDPEIMLVVPKSQKAFQGWRYLPAEKSPNDLHPLDPHHAQNQPDEKMAKELAELGLL